MPDYSLFSLEVCTPFELLGARPVPSVNDDDTAVALAFGPVPYELEAGTASGDYWQARPGAFLLRCGPSVGRFLVEDGSRITYQPSPSPDQSMVSFQIAHNLMAAVLRQRGLLVLHANTVLLERGGVAISGESGAGKSTTTAALTTGGGTLVADDVAALELDGETGGVLVHPGLGEMHLTQDSVAALGLEADSIDRYALRSKAVVPVDRLVDRPVRLTDLYHLSIWEGSDVRVVKQEGTALFDTLQDCIYGPLLPAETPATFPTQAALAQSVRVWRIQRPRGQWSLDAVVERILDSPSVAG